MLRIPARRVWALAVPILVAAVMAACTNYISNDGPPPADVRYGNDYYYYPRVGVYFHVHSGTYYYRDGPVWRHARSLPTHIYLDRHDRKAVVIRDREPYAKHDEHRERFRSSEAYRRDPGRDRSERQSNEREHENYRKRPGQR